MDVAQRVEREEQRPHDTDGKQDDRPVATREDQGARPAAQIAEVPKEEAQRDKGRGLEQRAGRLGRRDREHLWREDGEEHGNGKAHEDGGREPVELAEEGRDADDLAGRALGLLDRVERRGHVLHHAGLDDAVVAAHERDEAHDCQQRDENGRQKVDEGGVTSSVRALCGICRRFLGRRDEDRDDLGQGWQHAGNTLTGHDGLHILGPAKAGSKRKSSVLDKTSSPSRSSHHDQHKDEILARRSIQEGTRGDGKEGKHGNVDIQRQVDPKWIRRSILDIGENRHGTQVRDGRHGYNGRLEVLQHPLICLKSPLKVRSGREEHVPNSTRLSVNGMPGCEKRLS